MDSVLSYHMNPLTCGVAKFNLRLSRHLGVPLSHLFDPVATTYRAPLLSMKISEFRDSDVRRLQELLDVVGWRDAYALFLHEWSGTDVEARMIRDAREVFCGNSELAAGLASLRSDVVELWCPGTLLDARRFDDSELSVFTFGMAHKIRSRYYGKLKRLLDQTGKTYCLYLSTALHENTSFDESFSVAFDELREIFGESLHFLGYLSDSAVYNYLLDTTYFVAFFDRGVRANNTSVQTGMLCGSVVITNLDEHSPPAFVHMKNVIDINRCDELPTDPQALNEIRRAASLTVEQTYGWEALVRRLRGEGAETRGSEPETFADVGCGPR